MTDEDESACWQPCHPDSDCEECAEYWHRMVTEGYWNKERREWTGKGMRQIIKDCKP